MYKVRKPNVTTLQVNTATEGETIEIKMRRILNNKEPITDGAPLVYTERGEGVLPQYDIRTDKFEIAVEAMEKVATTHQGKRMKVVKDENEKEDGGAESTRGNTGTTQTGTNQ